jgi:hypothetical protein
MNVGFPPRLRARRSLYDLVRYRNVDPLSIRPNTPTRVEDLPPLPSSPTASSSFSLQPTPVQEEHPEPVHQSANMAPKKAARDADGEEQYGEFRSTQASTSTVTDGGFAGSIYSVSGYVAVATSTNPSYTACPYDSDCWQARCGGREHDRSCYV